MKNMSTLASRSLGAIIAAGLAIIASLSPLHAAGEARAQKAPATCPVAPKAQSAPTSKTASIKMSEEQKIDSLIKLVEKSGLHFLRNGSEYDSKKAAAHLREKYDYAHKRPRYAKDVATARDFIKNVATQSYLSGKPYQIRLKDGKLVPSGKWLTERLVEIEKNGPPPAAADPQVATAAPPAAEKTGK